MAVREIPAGRMLLLKMEDFRNAVPIIWQLKLAALRARHWTYLMDCTGRAFDWHADGTFQLREIFDMELHRFKVRWRSIWRLGWNRKERTEFALPLQDVVEGIIYKAIRELAIEETVTDIVSTWDSMAFIVLKYHKAERRTEVLETSSGPFASDSVESRPLSLLLPDQNNRPNNGNGDRRGAAKEGEYGEDGGGGAVEKEVEKEVESSTVPVVDEVVHYYYQGEEGEEPEKGVNHHHTGDCGDLKR